LGKLLFGDSIFWGIILSEILLVIIRVEKGSLVLKRVILIILIIIDNLIIGIFLGLVILRKNLI
jgi:hypothetical protein